MSFLFFLIKEKVLSLDIPCFKFFDLSQKKVVDSILKT